MIDICYDLSYMTLLEINDCLLSELFLSTNNIDFFHSKF